MARLSLTALAVALLAGTYGAAASAALYKWTDANGRAVYSDQPPLNAAKELAQREAEFKKRQADAAKAEEKAGKDRDTAEKRVEACAQAKGQLRQLAESQLAIYRYNEKGEREVMDDDARAREVAKINAWLRDNKC